MRRPIRTASTMMKKDHPRAPGPPLHVRIGPALAHRNANLRRLQRRCIRSTPSPVIATTSPFALRAFTSRSFCSGTMRAKRLVDRIRSLSSFSSIHASSAPVSTGPAQLFRLAGQCSALFRNNLPNRRRLEFLAVAFVDRGRHLAGWDQPGPTSPTNVLGQISLVVRQICLMPLALRYAQDSQTFSSHLRSSQLHLVIPGEAALRYAPRKGRVRPSALFGGRGGLLFGGGRRWRGGLADHVCSATSPPVHRQTPAGGARSDGWDGDRGRGPRLSGPDCRRNGCRFGAWFGGVRRHIGIERERS